MSHPNSTCYLNSPLPSKATCTGFKDKGGHPWGRVIWPATFLSPKLMIFFLFLLYFLDLGWLPFPWNSLPGLSSSFLHRSLSVSVAGHSAHLELCYGCSVRFCTTLQSPFPIVPFLGEILYFSYKDMIFHSMRMIPKCVFLAPIYPFLPLSAPSPQFHVL